MILGQNVPNLSHLPENIHKRFYARPAEKQDALFCCSVNFYRWRYGFESLPPAVTDKTATISEENSGEGAFDLTAQKADLFKRISLLQNRR